MSRHGGGSRVVDYEERDTYYSRGAPAAPQAPAVRIRERDREEVVVDRRGPDRRERDRPDFLRDDYGRSDQQGQLVVRERETETFNSRPLERRARSPSPPRFRERIERREVERREPSPAGERVRTRIVEREKETQRSPSPPPQLRARVIETRQRFRERSPSPAPPTPVRIRERIVERERERERSPSPPPAVERIHTRIVERREPSPSPSPSPPPTPPPEIIRAPPIHREIITHHRHIDHGFEFAPAPSPPPPPRRARTPQPPKTEKTEIDIYSSRNNTEVDITRTKTPAREREPVKSPPLRKDYYDDSIIYEQERDKLRVRDTRMEISRRRSLSARPDKERFSLDIRDEDEADFYNRKAEERAVIGEAFNGATKDWTIVDVPPGTERITLDGVGGASQEITWQRYNGVRRSKFNPERERKKEETERVERKIEIRERDGPERTTERIEIRERERDASPRESTTSVEIDISRKESRRGHQHGPTYEREREYERIEETNDRRVGFPLPRGPPKNRMGDLWTEITKDLVVKEAIEELGYDYEETEFFYYILQYLRYQDVEELVALSETIRRERQDRLRDIERERIRIERREKERDDWERAERRRDREFDDERIIEREIIWDDHRRRPSRRH